MKYYYLLIATSIGIWAAGCACKEKTVQAVGPCEWDGTCRVTYTDGSNDLRQDLPAVGDTVKDCQP